MKIFSLAALAVFSTTFLTGSALAQFSISPLNTFGVDGDGWLSPAESAALGTTSLERGMAYNPVNNHLYVTSRDGGTFVHILDASTGALLGGLNTTGISGGTFAINGIGVTDDGIIYAGNLNTSTTSANVFKLYRWASELAVPQPLTLSNLQTARLGDNFDVFGSETNGTSRVAAGYSAIAGYQFVDPTTLASNYVNVGGGIGFRGGISFVDGDTIWGTAGGTIGGGITRTETDGTLNGTSNLTASTERQFDITFVAGMWLMATVEVGGGTTFATDNCDVRIYDITSSVVDGTPGITLLGTANLAAPPYNSNNAGSAGSVQWGSFNGSDLTLYAMSTNNGIQAFNVQVVPEPTSAVFLVGSAFLLARRRRS